MYASLRADPRVTWVEDVLRFNDTDRLGHVNNAVFSVLCESGRVGFFDQRLTPTLPPGLFFVIARLVLDFRSELHYPGRIRTGTWLTKVGRSSIGLEQVILTEDEGLAATSQAVCVLMDGSTRRATPMPEPTRALATKLVREPRDASS